MSLWKIFAKTEVIRDVCEMQFTTCLHHSSVITGKTEPDLKTHCKQCEGIYFLPVQFCVCFNSSGTEEILSSATPLS